MPLSPALLRNMNQRVQFARFLSETGNTRRTYETPAKSYPCRIDQRPRLIRNTQGEQVVAGATIWMSPVATDGTTLLLADDDHPLDEGLVTMPDGATPVIAAVRTTVDRAGAHYAYTIYTT